MSQILRQFLFVLLVISYQFPISVLAVSQNATACLYPNTADELYLACTPNHLIHIVESLTGWLPTINTSNPSAACLVAVTDSTCTIQATNATVIVTKCSAMSSCYASTATIDRPSLSCAGGNASNFIQVFYECLPATVNGQPVKVDICGDLTNAIKLAPLPLGYITSLNYPSNYSPNTSCTCSLTAIPSPTSPARIILRVLDISLSILPNQGNPSDWLEFTKSGQYWGNGQRITATTADIVTGSDVVAINFKTDDQEGNRGFWLEYLGETLDGLSRLPVVIECNQYVPALYRSATSCFHPPSTGKIYLTCSSIGVINILGVHRDIQNASSCPAVQTTTRGSYSGCAELDNDISVMKGKCMSSITCNAPTSTKLLEECGEQSNFIQVDYQCIPDTGETGIIMEICGQSLQQPWTVVEMTIGYIKSVLYPSNYLPSTSCSCQLETGPSDSQIVFYMLDMELGGVAVNGSIGGCGSDWLEYGAGSLESPGNGVKLCGVIEGNPIYTSSNNVSLTFHSGAEGATRRGFWIKFVGRTSSGTNIPVRVKCGANSQTSNPKTETNGSAGLIAGLIVVSILIIIVLFLIAFYKYRKLHYVAGFDEKGSEKSWTHGLGWKQSTKSYSSFGDNQPKSPTDAYFAGGSLTPLEKWKAARPSVQQNAIYDNPIYMEDESNLHL